MLPPLKFIIPKPKSLLYPKVISSTGDRIRVKRLDLKLSQDQVADLFGVCTETVMKWELNRTKPAADYYFAIEKFLNRSLSIDK